VGLNRLKSDTYSAWVMFHWASGRMMGHEASTPATEYAPQWMNIPNLAALYQAVLSPSFFCAPCVGAGSSAFLVEDEPISKPLTLSPKRKTVLLACFFFIAFPPSYKCLLKWHDMGEYTLDYAGQEEKPYGRSQAPKSRGLRQATDRTSARGKTAARVIVSVLARAD